MHMVAILIMSAKLATLGLKLCYRCVHVVISMREVMIALIL